MLQNVKLQQGAIVVCNNRRKSRYRSRQLTKETRGHWKNPTLKCKHTIYNQYVIVEKIEGIIKQSAMENMIELYTSMTVNLHIQ